MIGWRVESRSAAALPHYPTGSTWRMKAETLEPTPATQ